MSNPTTGEVDGENSRSVVDVRSSLKHLIASFAIIGMLAIWFVGNYHGYSVRTADAATTEFSAERAIRLLTQLLGDESPHAAGSIANDAVRQRLVTHLEQLGLDVEQTPFEVNGVAMCNLLTSIPGDNSRRPILLATHYDSVAQGPGAADAGCCVAALLEVARIIHEQRASQPDQPLYADVYFLLTDGEEWVRKIGHGLNGAIHFVETDRHPLLDRDPIILNFDARGAAGPSLLYETSGNNLELLTQVLPALPRRAFTASSYVTVYDLLPNSTDFTIFKNAGLDGLNFAFIDDPHRYHTPEDSLRHLDHRSVQHHGENALAVTQHLLTSQQQDFSATQNAVFFTIFGEWIICYPEQYAVLFAAVLLVVQLLGTRTSLRRGARIGQMMASTVAVILAVVLSVLCGCIVMQFDEFRPQSFHGFGTYDPWIVGLLWLFALSAAWAVFKFFARSTSAESTWACVWLGNAVAGLLAAIYLPGFSYVMLTVGIVPAVLSLMPQGKQRMSVVAIAAAGIFSIPLAYQFGIALGPKMAVVLSGLYSLFLVPVFPLLANAGVVDDSMVKA